MADADELERIRNEKRERLQESAGGDGSADAAADRATPDEPIHVDGPEEFQALVAEHDVVLADFYADWCGPCKMIEPVVAELARETEAAVVKIDIDANQALAAQYQVQGVPTLYLFAGGEPAERIVGVRGKDELASLIERHAP